MRRRSLLSILLAIVFILTMSVPAMAATNVQSVTTPKKTTVSTTSATKKIKKYKKSAKKIKQNIKKATLAGTYAGRRTQYYNFVKRIKSVERKLDRLENTWERKYRRGKISYSKYRTIERKAERVEDYLDGVEDYLERKFSYEFDD